MLFRSNPDTSTITVIALSANAMPEQVARGLNAGFAEYLVKPLDLTQLLNTLGRFRPA